MRTERGKCYRSETGTKEGPMRVEDYYCWLEVDGLDAGPIWYMDGTPWNDEASEIGALVAEWEDDEWSEWEGVGWVTEHSAFYEGCVYQIEGARGTGAPKVRIKLRPEDKPAQAPAPRFTDDEINRIAKAVADAVAGALKP